MRATETQRVVVEPNLVTMNMGRATEQLLRPAVGVILPRIDWQKQRAIRHPLPVQTVMGNGQLNLIEASKVQVGRWDGPGGIEENRKADIATRVGQHCHLIDLGKQILVVE